MFAAATVVICVAGVDFSVNKLVDIRRQCWDNMEAWHTRNKRPSSVQKKTEQ